MEVIGWEWLDDSSFKWYQQMFGSLIKVITNAKSDGVKSYLKFDAFDATAINTMWDYFAAVGIALCVIYFLMDYSKTMLEQRGDFNVLSVFTPFLKLCAGLLFIVYGKELISDFLGLNNTLVDKIDTMSLYTPTTGSVEAGNTIKDVVKDLKLIQCLLAILFGLIVWLLSQLCYLVIAYQGISRKIEMILRAGFMPVAIGDVYKGADSNGFRFMKKFLAMCLWGFAMMAVIQIGNMCAVSNLARLFEPIASGANLYNIIPAVVSVLAFPLATAGMVSASKQVCMDVMGC